MVLPMPLSVLEIFRIASICSHRLCIIALARSRRDLSSMSTVEDVCFDRLLNKIRLAESVKWG